MLSRKGVVCTHKHVKEYARDHCGCAWLRVHACAQAYACDECVHMYVWQAANQALFWVQSSKTPMSSPEPKLKTLRILGLEDLRGSLLPSLRSPPGL